MLIVVMKVSDELLHLLQREPIRIQCENLMYCKLPFSNSKELIYLSRIHVIDVSPHGLQWYLGNRVICNNRGNFIDILHAVSALMEPKAPIWHHGGLADDIAVLLSDVNWAWTGKDVKVNDTSDHAVFEILPRGIAVDIEIHTIAVQHEDTMSLAAAAAKLEINWMIPVEVSPWRDQVRIPRPQCASIVSSRAPERVSILSEAIDIRIIRKRSANSDKLGLENECRS